MNPKVRPIQIVPMVHQGQRALMLRDPLHLTERVLVVSQKLGPALGLMDGTRSVDELRASLMIRAGLRLTNGEMSQLVDQLDKALLLHNERFLEVCDAVVAQYHDQGHIAAKLVDFLGGVNITLGLPIIRTSVDHGTAFDLAGTGRANPQSLINAIRYAQRMAAYDK